MEYTIIGPGAVGCYMAGALTRAGRHTVLVDHDAERASALNACGITVIHGDEEYTVRVDTHTGTADIPEHSVCLICVKAFSLDSLLKEHAADLVRCHAVLAVQNGILWLDVLERKGLDFTATDLLTTFVEKSPYMANEYSIAKRNFIRGIMPPASGRFNNQFWETGMGCAIRSEIWAFICPGNPELAARYAGIDGSIDHTNSAIAAGQMLAALEAQAFLVDDVESLVLQNLHYLPGKSRIRLAVEDVIDSHQKG